MMMTASQVHEMELDDFSGTITVFSPVRISRRLAIEFDDSKHAARYVLTFAFGNVSILRRGQHIELGVMNQGILELYQFGLMNEGVRHLLHPHTMQLERKAETIRDCGDESRLLEPYRGQPGVFSGEYDSIDGQTDETLRCRFWSLQMAFLYFVSVDRLRYWVNERRA